MKRNSIIHSFFSEVCPPFIRDNKKLMCFFAKITSENPGVIDLLVDFRKKLPFMSDNELISLYNELSEINPQLESSTDINQKCMEYIIDYAKNHPYYTSWFDCACGSGVLTYQLAALERDIIGMDIVISNKQKESNGGAKFIKGNILNIPYKNESFDVVVSAHTLEHIIRVQDAISELRRISKHTLIIIVPRQREYKYTFETHVHFFPYSESFHRIMENPNGKCFLLDGDILYIEEKGV